MRIRIAQVKLYPVSRQLENNHRRLMQVLESVAQHKPDVVITPEGFLDGYLGQDDQVTRENIAQYAIDPERSDYTVAIAEWAARNQTWFVFGCARRVAEGVHNTALIFNRKGRMIGVYDKTHCLSHDKKYVPGKALPVFESDFDTFGVLICADRRWPEAVRTLALKGARVIFNPTYGMHNEKNLRMMQTRSYESEVFIAFTHPAQSLITGPTGQIVFNDISEASTFNVTGIDLSEVDERRELEKSHLRNRRTDLYFR